MDLRTKETVEEGILHQETAGASTIVEYAPGNGTAYRLMITRLDWFSERTTMKFGSSNKGTAVVSDLNGGHSPVVVGNGAALLHYRRIKEKMGFNWVDSVVIAELLGHLLGLPAVSCEEYAKEYA